MSEPPNIRGAEKCSVCDRQCLIHGNFRALYREAVEALEELRAYYVKDHLLGLFPKSTDAVGKADALIAKARAAGLLPAHESAPAEPKEEAEP